MDRHSKEIKTVPSTNIELDETKQNWNEKDADDKLKESNTDKSEESTESIDEGFSHCNPDGEINEGLE